MKYVIKDWAGNTCFYGKSFATFENGWDFLYEKFQHLSDNEAEQEYQEYSVVEAK